MRQFRGIFSALTALALCLSLLPAAAWAAEETPAPEAPTFCTCKTLCMEGSVNADCPVCGAEGADLTLCAGTVPDTEAPEEDGPVADGEPANTDTPAPNGAPMLLDEPVVIDESGTGDFTVTGGTPGTDYTYSDNVLTVNDGANITISGTTTADHIVVKGDAEVTLDGVDIRFDDGNVNPGEADESKGGTCALQINSGAELTLTLSGENTLQSGAGRAGIQVAEDASVTIGGTGTLNVTGGNWAAGIGGGLWNNAGAITINGGTINAYGREGGAGIGGGHANDSSTHNQAFGGFANITIENATVTASSPGNAAGIGTGCWSKQPGKITIENAVVTASSDGTARACAAIGRGISPDGTTAVCEVTINGSIVSAANVIGAAINTGGEAATITNSLVAQGTGSANNYVTYGTYTLPGDFTLLEGKTLAIGSDDTLNLGGHTLTNNGTIDNGGTVTGRGSIVNSGTFFNVGTLEATVTGNAPISMASGSYTYLDYTGKRQTIEHAEIIRYNTTAWGTADSTTWYIALSSFTINQRVTVTGDVHLILADGCKLTVNGGIQVEDDDGNPETPSTNSLTIYAQSEDADTMGALAAAASGNDAGIGGNGSSGGYGSAGGTVTINGGVVTARGSGSSYGGGAGIGGGGGAVLGNLGLSGGSGGIVTINGGVVTAIGDNGAATSYGSGGAGIGGGGGSGNSGTISGGSGGTVTITGGTVTATGGSGSGGVSSSGGASGGAGIGGGGGGGAACTAGAAGSIAISGGTVHAVGGAGIGRLGGSGAAIGSGGGSRMDGTEIDETTFTNGVVFKGNTGTVYGNAALEQDLTVKSGQTLTIPAGTTLTIQEDVTLTIAEGGTLIMDGALINNGTFVDENGVTHAGKGSEESPYQIPDLATLVYYQELINSNAKNDDDLLYRAARYILTADIDLGGSEENQWTPIGTSDTTPFTGTFDGAGHSITGLYVNTTNYAGLFGCVGSGGTVKNLAVSGVVTVPKEGYAGGVVGASNGTIQNCYSECTVNGCPAGGIAGQNNPKGTVQNCFSTGPVNSTIAAGGVVGYNYGRITNCCSTSLVTGGNAGGVVGFLNNGTIDGCFYQEREGLAGVGFGDGQTTAVAKTYFTSGEVAWLLQGIQTENIWGQRLGTDEDEYPVLTSDSGLKVYRLTFQAEGSSDTVLYGNSGDVPAPADPVREGFTFNEWVTGSNVAYSKGMTLTADTTFTALWTSNTPSGGDEEEEPDTPSRPSSGGGSSEPSYSPSVDAGDGGEVSTNPRTPHEGDDVTITVEPDEGYEVDEVIVTDRNGGKIDVTANGDGTYTFEQPRGRVTISVTFRPIQQELLPFTDVAKGAWYYDAVAYAYANGLMSGTSSTTFAPDVTTSRGMIAAILWRIADSPVVNYLMDYDDVAEGSWYTEAIRWATSEGVVSGYGNGTFGPNDPITREQMAVMLYRYAQHMGYDVTARADLTGYTDADQISGYAAEALAWANAEGIVNGTGGGSTLSPQGEATRAQAAVMLMRFCQRYIDNVG